MSHLQRPGEHPARPGEYEERGPQGQVVFAPKRVTMEPGDSPLPPTSQPGRTWVWVGPPQWRQRESTRRQRR
jgi:hypothetical protein